MMRVCVMLCHILLLLIAPTYAGIGIVACKVCIVEVCGMGVLGVCASTCALWTLGYPLCLAGCMTAGCSPCAAVCATVATCFDNDTNISTPQGDKPIADVSSGELVFDGEGSLTRVVENVYVPGRVEMTTLKLLEPESSLTVTRNHWHYILGDEGQVLPVQASSITTGMMMSIRSSAASNSTIAKTESAIASGRWALSTASCSVYANGILSGTLCTNESAPLYTHQLQMITEANDYNIFHQ